MPARHKATSTKRRGQLDTQGTLSILLTHSVCTARVLITPPPPPPNFVQRPAGRSPCRPRQRAQHVRRPRRPYLCVRERRSHGHAVVECGRLERRGQPAVEICGAIAGLWCTDRYHGRYAWQRRARGGDDARAHRFNKRLNQVVPSAEHECPLRREPGGQVVAHCPAPVWLHKNRKPF